MANPTRSNDPIKIAVVGAGLVGAAAVLSLSRLSGAMVTAYERAPVPREAGAWISLSPSALAVLNDLVGTANIRRIVHRPEDNAVNVTRHWRTGKVLIRNYSSPHLASDYQQARTHRWPLLQALLAHIPKGTIRYGREVLGIDVQPDGARLRFASDVSEPYDLVVAADGIYSKLRRSYVPTHKIEYKGAVAYRKVFPVSLVEHIEGLPNDSYAWRSTTDVVFLSRLGLGMFGIVIIRPEAEGYATNLKWEFSIGTDAMVRLRILYKDWDPLIGQVLDLVDDLDAYPLDSGPWLKKLTRDNRVAFVGDAGHPTAGAYGAGAAMGFADCWALYRSIQATQAGTDSNSRKSGYDMTRALAIFNETRSHFLQRVEQQMTLDKVKNAYVSAAGDDEEEWVRRFVQQFPFHHWLTEHSVELEFQKTLESEALWAGRPSL